MMTQFVLSLFEDVIFLALWSIFGIWVLGGMGKPLSKDKQFEMLFDSIIDDAFRRQDFSEKRLESGRN